MEKNHTPNLRIRKEIYNFILEYPGLHLRELSRKLKIPLTTLTYHLRDLEQNRFVALSSEKRYNRVYPTGNIGAISKKVINAMRQKISCSIILYMGVYFIASQSELSKELELSPPTIAKHLKKLVNLGIIEPAPIENGVIYTAHKNKVSIERSPNGREVIYRLTRPANLNIHMDAFLCKLLNRYEKGLVDNTVKIFLEYLELVNPESKMPKKVKNHKFMIDQFEKRMTQVFPHPYYG